MVGAGRKPLDFEAAVERGRLAAGCVQGEPADLDAGPALTPKDPFRFIEATPPTRGARLDEGRPSGLPDALRKNPSRRGALDVVRHGLELFGERVAAAFFRPAQPLSPERDAPDAANRRVATRQVRRTTRTPRGRP